MRKSPATMRRSTRTPSESSISTLSEEYWTDPPRWISITQPVRESSAGTSSRYLAFIGSPGEDTRPAARLFRVIPSVSAVPIRTVAGAVLFTSAGRRCTWRLHMLHWSLMFLMMALIAAVPGFAGLAGAAVGIAKALFFVFLIVWLIALLTGRRAV